MLTTEAFRNLQGFKWTDEGRGKWGFVAHKEWSRLEIVVGCPIPATHPLAMYSEQQKAEAFALCWKGRCEEHAWSRHWHLLRATEQGQF